MSLCKYKRSCLPADSAAWQLTLMTSVCYFRLVQEALPSCSPGCEAWASLPSSPATGAWTSYVPEGLTLPEPLSSGSGSRGKILAGSLCERKLSRSCCNWGFPRSCLEDPKHLKFSITFKFFLNITAVTDEVRSQKSRDKDILSGPFSSKDESHHRDHVCKFSLLVEWSSHYNFWLWSSNSVLLCSSFQQVAVILRLACVSESISSVSHTKEPATHGEALMYFSSLTSAVSITEEE